MAVSWVVFWAGRLIQAVSGRSRIFGAPTVPKRCGVADWDAGSEGVAAGDFGFRTGVAFGGLGGV